MSQPSRPRSRGKAQRVSRDVKLERPVPLEQRNLMAPVVATYPLTATFTAAATPTNSDLGSVTVSLNTATTSIGTMAPITSVSELTSTGFVRQRHRDHRSGPGGVFGNDVYAISRGAGDNNGLDGRPLGVNHPGVIYRVDPATGQSSVFFDLNSVISQIDPSNATPSTPAANGLLTSIGAGQLVQHHVRFGRDLQRNARDVRQQCEQDRPRQEHHLRDCTQRYPDGGVHPDDRWAGVDELRDLSRPRS